MKTTKKAFLSSLLALLLCITMFMGTTFAWFTDSVTSSGNKIVAGSLKVDLEVLDEKLGVWYSIKNDQDPIFFYDKWEPGYTDVTFLKVENEGTLALKWEARFISDAAVSKLAEVIDVYVLPSETELSYANATRDLDGWTKVGTLDQFINTLSQTTYGSLDAGKCAYLGIALHMQEDAGNEYQGIGLEAFDIKVVATQLAKEEDSFGPDYDEDAKWPELPEHNTASAPVTLDADGRLTADVTLTSADGSIVATVPAGTKFAQGTSTADLNVNKLAQSGANITLEENEETRSFDVHVQDLADDNTAVISIAIAEFLPVGLNMGNYKLYHVEDTATVEMTLLADGDAPVHNSFNYDPATGDVVLHLASFSEVAAVADTENAWEGKLDYSWYDDSKTELQIANADQLAAFGAIVGGMKKVTDRVDGKYTYSEEVIQDSFSGKYIKLVADVNIGDINTDTVDASENGIVFYPIGYWNSEGTYEKSSKAISSGFYNFEGTFDGNGNTISNFYQNTWEMKGDHNWYDATLQYYRDGMGLFGKVYGGTVKNLTVDNFSSDGEIATTGVIAAYADGATFENIAITNCNPRVYNIGNGGIVGCVGWYAKEAGLKTTFKNITVDNTNKISALWGSYDVACGGIVGQYYPTSGQTSAGTPKNGGISFENCHVAAQMDVYNDVCANYQYYAYRYTGMLIGSVRENETIDGHVYPKMDGITASGCTVHFGDWNDYYYCELVANSLASYTHDHQFSRLEQVASVEGTTITPLKGEPFTVPATGRYNYVVINGEHATENATCYHFVDGKVHNHDDYNGDGVEDYETVNGESIRVENNRHIYLEFNNLVTGYGWGVTSKGVGDLAGVTILDREVGNSVNKFNASIQNGSEFDTESTVTIGELFEAIENADVAIKSDNVQVAVSPFGATSTAGGTYAANTSDWTQGTLTFSGVGQAVITITDYYFCKTTTVTVNVVGTEKFDTNFVNYKDYLYRVGNADNSPVALGTIFKHNGQGTIQSDSVEVTFNTVAGNASGTFAGNTSDWTKGTIQFTGTGVVTVTIKDATSKEFVLNLEVVDAVNATGAMSATSNNVVLLNDVAGTFSVSGGFTFYGNGFKVTLPTTSTSKWSSGFVGYINLNGGNLDNVQIIGHVFPAANIYREQAGNETDGCTYFHNSVIINSGDCKITNSYVSGSRAAIYVKGGGEVFIENTTVSGGAYANIEVSTVNSIVLKNVTTEQKELSDSYGQSKKMIGLGIVINDSATDVYIEGAINQYNWITYAHWSAMLGTYEDQFPALFTDSTYSKYWHYRDGDANTKYVNTSLIFACDWNSSKLHDNRTDKSIAYDSTDITVVGKNGAVYSVTDMGTLTDELYLAPTFIPCEQYPVAPSFSFDFTNKNYQAVGSTNEFCYNDGEMVRISFDEGGSKVWDTSILTVTKVGNQLDYTASMNATDYTGRSITFTNGGDYIVTYTYIDPYNYKFNDNGDIVTYSKEYTQTVKINVTAVAKTANNAEFTMGTSNNIPSKVQVGNDVYLSASGLDMSNWTEASATFGTGETSATTQSIKYSGKTNGSWASTTINGTTYYLPVVAMGTTDSKFSHTGSWYGCFPVFEGAIIITDYADGGTGTEVVYNSSTTTMPTNLVAIYPQSSFRHQGTTSKVPTEPSKMTKGTYNGKLCYTTQTDLSASNERNEEWILVKYKYTDNAGKTYYWFVAYYCAASTNGGCVTGDTLVTLADGTQKRIDALEGTEMLLAWDFYKGEYTVSPVGAIVNHGYDVVNRVTMRFADGSTINILRGHGFYDVCENKFVIIDEFNIVEYVGHEFVKYDANGSATTTTLIDYSIDSKYEEIWTIVSAVHFNCVLNGHLTLSPTDYPDSPAYLMPFEIGEGMKYDEAKMQADIEKYGQYTYEDFAEYCTYEQFVGFNFANWKVAVGKGYINFEDIVWLIETYVN